MTPTDKLAAAARKLCVARAGEGYDTLEHELAHALDDYDQQEILKVQIRSRVSDDALIQIWEEELAKAQARQKTESMATPGFPMDWAAIASMRRVANYAEHLVKMMVLLYGAYPIDDFVYKVREDEGLGWEGPRVKAFGEACGAIIGEVKSCQPPKPPAPAEDPVALPLGHA